MASDTEVGEPVAASLGALLDAGDEAMVTLVAGDVRLAVHRAVLVAGSPVFAAMFRHDTAEAGSSVVHIADMEGPVLRELVAHLYSQRAPQLPPPTMALSLLVAADRYGVSGLRADCEHQAVAQLTVENAAATAVMAVRHSCRSLAEAAVAFIRANLQVTATEGWARAVRNQPEDVIEVSRLLGVPPAETRTPGSDADQTGPPDEATVSGLRLLSEEERNRRLVQAVQEGELRAVRALLAAGADAGATDWGGTSTALHYAAEGGRAEAARALLAAGARVDARDCEQSTPLHWAAFNGRAAVIRLLAAAAADLEARNFDRRTALHDAARRGHTEATAALLELGVDAAAAGGARSGTALHFAAEAGHLEVMRTLLRAGAQVDAGDRERNTPLHRAAFSGHAAAVRLLAECFADVGARSLDGSTPLHEAARAGHAEAAEALLAAGADRGARNSAGATPLGLAMNNNHHHLEDILG